ncbi:MULTISPECIES: hypothetical protein [Pseudomonas]|uniref:Uncharacterized protein n=1 Tax=Pseudomonas alloputida TaxID=1940621 RepID=A0ABY3CZV8_9PSED|nr:MULTISPECIES: hypothetical protein [Pseudomonas putida group]MCO6692559.1 hypothetical protein [Pseudomonas shirazica]MCZ9640603.1 hypothetical protein [Pseudomonas putida]TRZ57753.1 hypothetical protein DZA28_28010 [Pseudomonas alloputida]HEE9761673.1 hypothetical protein [Pseudomonas putida]
MATLTAIQARNKIQDHLLKGAGIYAYHPQLGERYFKARVCDGKLEVYNGYSWFEVPRGTKFNNGNGSAGDLFTY